MHAQHTSLAQAHIRLLWGSLVTVLPTHRIAPSISDVIAREKSGCSRQGTIYARNFPLFRFLCVLGECYTVLDHCKTLICEEDVYIYNPIIVFNAYHNEDKIEQPWPRDYEHLFGLTQPVFGRHVMLLVPGKVVRKIQ